MRAFSTSTECEPGPEDLTLLEFGTVESASNEPERNKSDNEPVRNSVGILIHDPTYRRLVETATAHLELTAVTLDERELTPSVLSRFEMIVAEESEARAIQSMLTGREEHAGVMNPAVVAMHHGGRHSDERSDARSNGAEAPFDGALTLPIEPAPLLAQLSLILYAHRAFARRYSSALEELHLNRRIFRSVTSGISVANASRPDMPLVYVNPAFEVMTGYALEEVLGRNCRFLQGRDTDQPGLTVIRAAIREHRESVAVLKNYRKDGSAFWNELSLSPIRNRDGVVTHFVGIQTDVTARVEFEAALRESEKLAAVGRLASTIAHEINNPLESVMNLLFLAQTTADPVEIRRYLTVADQELRRVSLITAQSLRFYKQSTKPQPVRASELLDSVLNMYAGQLENANVLVDRGDRTASLVVCLESEIRQVLNNLVRNAIDAMRATGGRLLLRTREGTDERSGRRGVVVAVADTGSGMSRETLKHICTAFFTTKGISGTGLGLWISTEIVGRHHGRLSVRSSQRHGATGTVFRLFLPFQGVSSPS